MVEEGLLVINNAVAPKVMFVFPEVAENKNLGIRKYSDTKFDVRLRRNNTCHYLGTFGSFDDAYVARESLKIKLLNNGGSSSSNQTQSSIALANTDDTAELTKELESLTEVEQEVVLEIDAAETVSEIQQEPEPDIEVVSEAVAEVEVEIEAVPEVEVEIEAVAEVEVEPEAVPEVDAEKDTAPEIAAETEPDAALEIEIETILCAEQKTTPCYAEDKDKDETENENDVFNPSPPIPITVTSPEILPEVVPEFEQEIEQMDLLRDI